MVLLRCLLLGILVGSSLSVWSVCHQSSLVGHSRVMVPVLLAMFTAPPCQGLPSGTTKATLTLSQPIKLLPHKGLSGRQLHPNLGFPLQPAMLFSLQMSKCLFAGHCTLSCGQSSSCTATGLESSGLWDVTLRQVNSVNIMAIGNGIDD